MQSSQSVVLDAQIPNSLCGWRLDQAIAHLFSDYSRARLQAWIREGKVQVDGKQLRAKDKVVTGQIIHLETILATETFWQAQNICLNIVYEDEHLLVVNKPAGLVVHPAAGNPDQTLVNALLYHEPQLKNVPRAGIVHRLDKDTSGLLVIARTLPAHAHLVNQIQAHAVKREYLAIVNGTFTAGGTISAPMARHPRHRTRMAVIESGKHAVTHYRVQQRFRAHTALQIFLETGRTHQIRVHMAHLGHSLVGDPTYGQRLKIPPRCMVALQDTLRGFKRQALHAASLSLMHPYTGELMHWQAPLPEDINALVACLQANELI